ncbi:catalase [Fundidesulfovibrio terrae]|uniref:catalase n=1 Tax=Fundidesulfovibrio terrae TaxID=2922866 RepID=UPI0024358AE7|nr:catalase [Fundidesulfovibrio terrae]
MSGKKTLTTAFAIPVGDDQNSMPAGGRGPALVQNVHPMEKLARFDRERSSEEYINCGRLHYE